LSVGPSSTSNVDIARPNAFTRVRTQDNALVCMSFRWFLPRTEKTNL